MLTCNKENHGKIRQNKLLFKKRNNNKGALSVSVIGNEKFGHVTSCQIKLFNFGPNSCINNWC